MNAKDALTVWFEQFGNKKTIQVGVENHVDREREGGVW
jgi:hypothetical protein